MMELPMLAQVVTDAAAQAKEGMGTGTAVGLGAVAAIAVGGVVRMGLYAMRKNGQGERASNPVAMFDKGRCDAHGRKLEEQGKSVALHTTDIAVLKVSLGNMEKQQVETAADVKELLRRVPESKA